MSFDALFQPIAIGPIKVKNRFVVPPMGNNFANTDGTWSDQSVAYYAERAKGGFGLITIEATVVHEGAKGGARKPCLYSDTSIESLSRIVEACHAHGAKVSVQLQHAGPEGNAACAGAPLRAASPIPAACGKEVPIPLTAEEIYTLVEGYAQAARRALAAGVDAVEIHMAHGYLLSSFLSPRTNKRLDEFGGSFENRLRFPRLVFEAVKEVAGSRIAVLARINAADEEPGGLDVHDSAAIARALQECGLDGLHVSRAVHLKDEWMWAPTAVHGGFNAELVSEIKRAVSIPVITVGRFTEPHYAALLVEQRRADLVAFGRQSLADPRLPKKAFENRLEDLTPCIACLQGCVANMYQGKPIRCLANPCLGHESTPLRPASAPLAIAVVGGGPAGLVAAYTLAEQGHTVTLYEKDAQLGGNFALAAYPPGKGDIAHLVSSYITRCKKAGVVIHTNHTVEAQELVQTAPDIAIIATGAAPIIPAIPGLEESNFILGSAVLSGQALPGKSVLIIGGGMVGCETADFLAELGHQVTVLDSHSTLGTGMIQEHKKLLFKNFENHHVTQITDARVTHLYPDGATYETPQGEEKALRSFDSVVLCVGYQKNDSLSESLQVQGITTYVIGDAIEARRALNATEEAYELASHL